MTLNLGQTFMTIMANHDGKLHLRSTISPDMARIQRLSSQRPGTHQFVSRAPHTYQYFYYALPIDADVG